MGEKRPYKLRKPGGGRKKLKPEFDARENLKEQMERAVALYEEDCSLQDIADGFAHIRPSADDIDCVNAGDPSRKRDFCRISF